jgi:hypothetical protein
LITWLSLGPFPCCFIFADRSESSPAQIRSISFRPRLPAALHGRLHFPRRAIQPHRQLSWAFSAKSLFPFRPAAVTPCRTRSARASRALFEDPEHSTTAIRSKSVRMI